MSSDVRDGAEGRTLRGPNRQEHTDPESAMTTATPAPSLARSQRRRAVFASTVGTTIEWYDFFLYGTAAGLVFDKLYFNGLDGPTAQLAACLLYTSPSPRDLSTSRMPSSA